MDPFTMMTIAKAGQSAQNNIQNMAGVGLGIIQQAIGGGSKATPPPLEDLEMRALLDSVRDERAALNRGSGTAYAESLRNLTEGVQATGAGAVSAAGGNKGSLNRVLLDLYKSSSSAFGDIIAKMKDRSNALLPIQENILSSISKRKYELQLNDYFQKKAEQEQNKKAGSQNILAALTRFGGGIGGNSGNDISGEGEMFGGGGNMGGPQTKADSGVDETAISIGSSGGPGSLGNSVIMNQNNPDIMKDLLDKNFLLNTVGPLAGM